MAEDKYRFIENHAGQSNSVPTLTGTDVAILLESYLQGLTPSDTAITGEAGKLIVGSESASNDGTIASNSIGLSKA